MADDAKSTVQIPKSAPKPGQVLVFTPYITRKGKRIYHPTGGLFVFWGTPQNRVN